jgi:hypothetical protein
MSSTTRNFAVATTTLQSMDIIEVFLHHMQRIGAANVVIVDLGSQDGTQDLIRSSRWKGFAHLLEVDSFANDDSSNRLLDRVRDYRYGEWCLFCDPDELPDSRIGTIAVDQETSCVSLPRFNVTARREALSREMEAPWPSLRLEVVKPVQRDASDQFTVRLSPPWIFGAVQSKVIVRVSRTVSIGEGDHSAELTSGHDLTEDRLSLRHYPVRSFAAFDQKVKTAEAYLAANPQFEEGWGWHWRRWIRIRHAGKLKEEFLDQYPTNEEIRPLIAQGVLRETEPIHTP